MGWENSLEISSLVLYHGDMGHFNALMRSIGELGQNFGFSIFGCELRAGYFILASHLSSGHQE